MELARIYYHRTTSWNTPYTFSGKEKDVETGYGYFGARYYDSGLSIWLSVDPMSDKYPSMSPYNYCANNPVMLVDPDGREVGPEDPFILTTPENINTAIWEPIPTSQQINKSSSLQWRHRQNGTCLVYYKEGNHYHLYENLKCNRRFAANGLLSGTKSDGDKLSRGQERFHFRIGDKLNMQAINRTLSKSLNIVT